MNHLRCLSAGLAGAAIWLITGCAAAPTSPNQQDRYGGLPPDCWQEARIYQTDDDAYSWATRTKIESVAAARPAEVNLSPNKAYYFAFTDEMPHQSVLVFSEKDRFTRITFTDLKALSDVKWINEKLLYMRVWWGRIAATDLVFDVETGRMVLTESTHDGQGDMEQYRDMCARLGGCRCIEKTAP